MKKWGVVFLTAVLTMGVVGCGGTAEKKAVEPSSAVTEVSGGNSTSVSGDSDYGITDTDPQITINLANGANDTQQGNITCLDFKKMVEERSGGKIKVNNYPANQMGSDIEMFESLQAGDLQMVWETTGSQGNFIPELAIADLPVYYADLEEAYNTFQDEELKEHLRKLYADVGVKLLNIYPTAFREMTSNKKVEKIEDFTGIKIRTMDNQNHMAFWQAIGANPTPLAFSEVIVALQQGLIDAQENPIENINANNTCEVQDYLILTHHVLFLDTLVMNLDFYNGLPESYQKLISDAASEASANTYERASEVEAAALAEIKQKWGTEVIELSDEVRTQMKEKAAPNYTLVYDKMGEELTSLFEAAYERAAGK